MARARGINLEVARPPVPATEDDQTSVGDGLVNCLVNMPKDHEIGIRLRGRETAIESKLSVIVSSLLSLVESIKEMIKSRSHRTGTTAEGAEKRRSFHPFLPDAAPPQAMSMGNEQSETTNLELQRFLNVPCVERFLIKLTEPVIVVPGQNRELTTPSSEVS